MDIADYELHYFHQKVNRLVSALLNAGLVISGQKVPHPIDKYSTTFRFYVIYMYLLTFFFDNTTVHFDLLQKSFTNIYHYVVCHFMSNFNF